MRISRSLIFSMSLGLLSGCAAQPTAAPPVVSQPPQASQAPPPQTSQAPPPKPASQASAPPSFQRGTFLSQGGSGGGGGEQAKPVNQYAAAYPAYRLEKAAQVKNYAHVSVVPVGIDAFIKTAWREGFVHIRLALLGPLKNLREFAQSQNDVKITFQDRAGNPIKVIIVPMSELQEARQGTNYGTPTFAVEGQMDCSLELYEEFYQWMFEWE